MTQDEAKKYSSSFGFYSGKFLFQDYHPRPRDPIIRGLLYELDHVMIIATEKVGKSVFCTQMGLCIASGTDFLDKLEVPYPRPVLYVQGESTVDATYYMLNRMAKEIPVYEDNFGLIYQPYYGLDTQEGFDKFCNTLDEKIGSGELKKPDVIFFDPLYKIISDYNDNKAVTQFTQFKDQIRDRYSTAIVVIHHEHKEKMDYKGNVLHEAGGVAATGSRVASYDIDAGFRMRREAGSGARTFSKYASRSGKVVKKLDLVMVGEDDEELQDMDRAEIERRAELPLYFSVKHKGATEAFEFVRLYMEHDNRAEGVEIRELVNQLKLSRETIHKALRHWVKKKVVERLNPHQNPARYKIIKGEK